MTDSRFDRRWFCTSAVAGGTLLPLTAAAFDRPANEGATPLRVGVAETTITPPAKGTFLIGPMQSSTGVHDELHARALVLSDGTTRLLLLTVDLLGFDFAFNDELVAAVSEAIGIPRDHVMVNCSHNHSAPLSVPWGPWREHREEEWRSTLPARLAAVSKEAAEALRPAILSMAREPIQVGFNRRTSSAGRIVMVPNPKGPVLPWVDVLHAAREGAPDVTLFSHAAHPVVVHAASTLITADYPGFAVETARRGLGDDAVCLFAQGCCGNVNGFPLQGGIDAAKAVGRDLGTAVVRTVRDRERAPCRGRLRATSHDLVLPLQSPPPADRLRELIAGERNAEKRARREALLAIAESGERRTMRYPIRAFAVGTDLAIVGLPHDTFAEYHRHAEAASPFRHTMVFAYTNGLECYVGTEADYGLGDRGGYETSPFGAALMFESRLPLAPEAERSIRKALGETLRALHRSAVNRSEPTSR